LHVKILDTQHLNMCPPYLAAHMLLQLFRWQ